MSKFKIHQVTQREELNQIVLVIWAAMETTDPSHPVFYPILTSGPESRAEAIRATQERIWNEHCQDDCSTWVYVCENVLGNGGLGDVEGRVNGEVEGDGGDVLQNGGGRENGKVGGSCKQNGIGTGKVVGGCQWRIYEKNPFKDGIPEVQAHWWPEGESRAFASDVIRQLFSPRTVWMARPHVGLSLMCVHPEYQRRGVGRLLMQWGMDAADSLGLESFVEATPLGKFLYQPYGYQSIKEVSVVRKEGASEEWRLLEEKLLPIGYTAMWRPVKGIWDPHEQEKTWKERMGTGVGS